MFPQTDRHRGNYEMKENKLGKLISEVLGVPEKEKKRLLGFRDAGLQEGFRCIPGDFSSVLFSVVEVRASYASAGLTVGDINLVLDHLSVEYEDAPLGAGGGAAAMAAAATGIMGKNVDTSISSAAVAANANAKTTGLLATLLRDIQSTKDFHQKNLGQMSKAADKQDKASYRVLLAAVRKLSPVEIKWLSRFILKDTKLGFSPESVLSRFHKDALGLYQEVADLKMVLDRLRLGVNSAEPISSVNFLFQRMQPMLGGRIGVEHCDKQLFGYWRQHMAELEKKKAAVQGEPSTLTTAGGAAANKKDDVGKPAVADPTEKQPASSATTDPITQMKPPAYYVETKLDGERMLCHIDRAEGRLELFTRNGNDYTPRYGPQMKETILNCFGGEQGILDGEILGFDEQLQCFLPFGTNRAASQDMSGKTHLCYMIFDILMMKGKNNKAGAGSSSSDEKPKEKIFDFRQNDLQSRKAVLKRVIRPRPNWVELVEPRGPYESAAEIERELTEAVERREEG
eukprot:g10948.t1